MNDRVWVSHGNWDACSPLAFVLCSTCSLLQGVWSGLVHRCAGWEVVRAYARLSGITFSFPIYWVCWCSLPMFPPKALVGKRQPAYELGGYSVCWVGRGLAWRWAFLTGFFTFLLYLSVNLWLWCSTPPPLLRSLCLSLITFFHLTALLVFSFSLPLFLCRPDQRWQ